MGHCTLGIKMLKTTNSKRYENNLFVTYSYTEDVGVYGSGHAVINNKSPKKITQVTPSLLVMVIDHIKKEKGFAQVVILNVEFIK
jgi:hypothetical protein